MKDTVKKVAIMQPYFIPYTGYFRLLSETDLFVIYDCVQFQRRGWLHRNKLPDQNGTLHWLTLPLEKAPQSVIIKDLKLVPNAGAEIAQRLGKFPLKSSDVQFRQQVLQRLVPCSTDAVDYISEVLKFFAEYLGIQWNVVRSSTLDIPAYMKGADRIVEIVKRVGGTHYLNSPGGRELYNAEHFAENSLKLEFLPEFSGDMRSILSRALDEGRGKLKSDLKL